MLKVDREYYGESARMLMCECIPFVGRFQYYKNITAYIPLYLSSVKGSVHELFESVMLWMTGDVGY